jgi:peptidyl-prolyl cis-trans isomerase SurA
VAIVNNEVITLHELNNKIKEMTGVEQDILRRQDEKKYLDARREILKLLIDEKISSEKIRELGIDVEDGEVDAAIERIKKDNYWTHEDLLAELERKGMDYESYRISIKQQIERMRLINFAVKSKIIIREEKLRDYYEEHKDKFESPEKLHLAIILLKQESRSNQDPTGPVYGKAKEILLKLQNGEDFGQLAREFSKGPGAEEGGDVGFYEISELDPELASILDKMSDGDVSEPIVKASAIQIVKLVERHEGSVKPFDEVKDAIFGILYREEVNKRYSSWIKELREKAYIKIIF